MTTNYDVIVIGSGPAGYVAAIRCAQMGMKTACIEEKIKANNYPALGGTCLNVGCIPSKTLLESSDYYQTLINNSLQAHGINIKGNVHINTRLMMERKDNIVMQLVHSIGKLFRTHGVDCLLGHGRILDKNHVELTNNSSSTITFLRANNIIIATGSTPIQLACAPVDNELGVIVDSTGALNFQDIPENFGIIGAGVVGLEIGSIWNRLGSKVVIFESMPKFLTITDKQIAVEALKQLRAQGLDIRLGTQVIKTDKTTQGIVVTTSNGSKEENILFDKLMVSIGRKPNINNITTDEVKKLLIDDHGYIKVNDYCETSISGVYAIGDVVRGPMLAHKSSEEGLLVADIIAGHHRVPLNYRATPWVIYTNPEIAWVGDNEQDLVLAGIPYKIGMSYFRANGRAKVMGKNVGMVKILAHAETDNILGCHILGCYSSELIQEVVLAIEMSASSEDLARTMHSHPTLYEVVHEAALAIHGWSPHKL